MTLGWVIAGSIFQSSFTFFLLLISIFAFSAVANTHTLSSMDDRVLSSSFYVVPLCGMFSIYMVISGYRAGAGGVQYLWYLLPFAVTLLYFLYVAVFVEEIT